MLSLSRRQLLGSAATAALVGSFPSCAGAPVGSRRLRVGVAGLRRQGWVRLNGLLQHPDVDVVALADPDASILQRAGALIQRFGASPRFYANGVQMIADGDLDAVWIATPDHWHALLGIAACEAGMDVFVEMPAVHGIEEGTAMVAAARRTGRLVHAGLDAREQPGIRAGMEFVRSGGVGAIRRIDAICYRYRRPLGQSEGVLDLPEHIRFADWIGPARQRPPRRRRLHGDWRFVWETGNGELGEAGTELLDLARWALGHGGGRGLPQPWPDRIWTCAGRLGPPDDGETPNTMLAFLEFGEVPVCLRQRALPAGYGAGTRMDRFQGLDYGLWVTGAKASMVFRPRSGLSTAFDATGQIIQQFRGRGDGLLSFVDAALQRRELSVDIELGRSACDLAHLLAIAHRSSASAGRIEGLRQLAERPELLAAFDDLELHIGRNGIDFDRARLRLSGWQRIDPDSGRFLDDPRADALRARSYRSPYRLVTEARSDAPGSR